MNERSRLITALKVLGTVVAVLSMLCFVVSGMQSLLRRYGAVPAYPQEYRDFEDWT